MKRILITSFIFVTILAFFSSCERDDICAAATVTTPKLVIEFFDINNPGNPKNVRDLVVSEVENDTTGLLFNSPSSIAVPLKTNDIETKYVFNLNANSETGGLVDTLTFSYATDQLYVNRACGFKVNFIDFRASIETEANPDSWIEDIRVRENSIENEFETHIFIFY